MSTVPPDGPPEYLEQGGGGPLPSEPATGHTRRNALIAGGAIAGLVLVGGGIWAATSFFGTGPQPAEALPASTIGYASIDLDPSGSQKIEAVKMLRKFPAFKDKIGLDTKDDIRKKLFDEIQKDAHCSGLDYADDIEPWLGDRAAVAAVDEGKDQPTPVLVLQVKDADKADAGLDKIKSCASGDSGAAGSDSGGWAVNGDWAIIAETDKIAQQVADDAANSSLADDEDYQHWTDEVGDAGIVNLYAAPKAGQFLADNLGSTGMFGGSASSVACSAGSTSPSSSASPGSSEPYSADPCDGAAGMSAPNPAPAQVTQALKDFKGMAATLRFNDGALELEVAGDPGASSKALYGTDRGDDVVATLPEDTAAAVGVGFDKGWFSAFVDQMASYSGGRTSADDLLRQMSQASGLDLPDDAETLAGDSTALAVGPDFDLESMMNSSDASGLPVAVKVKGDPEAVDGVLEKLRAKMTSAQEADALGSDSSGDMIAIGPNADYRSQVLKQGRLGDSAAFKGVIPEADKASALLFVNFDAGDWLTGLAQGDQEIADNLKPLQGLGMSAWRDGDTSHAVLRITTD
ncbi:MAG TPA: DUF3352 domain-containing protein [Candidatus Deferrimicrobium sp.]|nr:DUF3352 domain-containing protein [Candidatus Deferrimicrobium sp.]